MVTVFPLLVGGFGNRLFILAFAYSYCKKHNLKLKIQLDHNKHTPDEPYRFIYERFLKLDMYDHTDSKPEQTISEITEFKYTEFPKVTVNTLFRGYFQSSEYFENYKDDLIKLFSPDKEYPEYDTIVHVRLGDYVGSPHFIDLTRYFSECLKDQTDVVIMSDSPDQVYKIYPVLKKYKIIDSGLLESFYSMAKCKTLICSNSTLSWLAGWLQPKNVFLPNRWYLNYKNIELKDSIVVSV